MSVCRHAVLENFLDEQTLCIHAEVILGHLQCLCADMLCRKTSSMSETRAIEHVIFWAPPVCMQTCYAGKLPGRTDEKLGGISFGLVYTLHNYICSRLFRGWTWTTTLLYWTALDHILLVWFRRVLWQRRRVISFVFVHCWCFFLLSGSGNWRTVETTAETSALNFVGEFDRK